MQRTSSSSVLTPGSGSERVDKLPAFKCLDELSDGATRNPTYIETGPVVGRSARSACRYLAASTLLLLLGFLSAVSLSAPGLSPGIYRTLTDIRERMDAGAYRDSIRRLQELERETAGDSYALAVVHQYLGYAHLGRDDYPAAFRSFQQALDLKALPSEVSRNLHRVQAQLCMQLGKPKEAAHHLQSWLSGRKHLESSDHAVAAQVYYADGEVKTAIGHLEQAVAATAKPEEAWLSSLLAMYLEAKRYKKARGLLQRLIARNPAHGLYWRHLARLHIRMGELEQAVAVLTLAYEEGLLEAGELTRFAALYAHVGVPEKAARLMQEWRKMGRLRPTRKLMMTEADLWVMARERKQALGVLRLAQTGGGDGGAALKEARLLFQDCLWAEAAETFQRALQQGGLSDAAEARLLLGIAAYRAGNARLAGSTLEQAAADTKTAGLAKQWQAVLGSDLNRQN